MHTRLQFLRAAIYSLGEHADALRSDIYRINHRQHWWIRLHDVAVGQCTAIPQLLSVPHCSRPHEDMLICVDYLLNTSDNTKYFNQRVCLLFVRHCPVLQCLVLPFQRPHRVSVPRTFKVKRTKVNYSPIWRSLIHPGLQI